MFGIHIRHCYAGSYCLDEAIVANSTAIAIGDPLVRDTDGFLIVATANLRIEGIADQAFTSDASNETVAAATCAFIPSNNLDQYEADSSAAIGRTNESQYFKLTGTTGAVQVDFSTASDSAGHFRVIHRDPRGESSTTRVLVNLSELESLAAAQV